MSTPSSVVSTHHIATNTPFTVASPASLTVIPAPFTVIPAQAGIQGENDTMDKQFYVYMLASERNGTLYIGVTSKLAQRVWQHKNKQVDGFTRRYGVDKLVYYEVHRSAETAMTREKRIKKWRRAWKIRLIEEANPEWEDLYDDIAG